ncbi:hypothetical protein [Nocardia brasiliensis]|uniref:hypothetical protein n=1 Tax=Nocardia brasiliensis TaxID=37326 RepID=UPI002459097B|nr:hypothetical protein [Nocardia brasiliensis]
MSTDAFGRIDGEHLRSWMPGRDGYITLSGTWGMVAAVATLATVAGAVLYLGTRSTAWAMFMALASVVTAVSVCSALLYLQSRAPELRDMTMMPTSEFNTGVRAILHRLLGAGSTDLLPATAKLDVPGMVASVTAVSTAVTAMAATATCLVRADNGKHPAQAPRTHQPVRA